MISLASHLSCDCCFGATRNAAVGYPAIWLVLAGGDLTTSSSPENGEKTDEEDMGSGCNIQHSLLELLRGVTPREHVISQVGDTPKDHPVKPNCLGDKPPLTAKTLKIVSGINCSYSAL